MHRLRAQAGRDHVGALLAEPHHRDPVLEILDALAGEDDDAHPVELHRMPPCGPRRPRPGAPEDTPRGSSPARSAPATAAVPYDPAMPDPTPLPDHVRAFLAAPGRFATLATLDPDGTPRQAVIWYRLDADGRIVINSADGRRWPANLRRDPRCSLVDRRPGRRLLVRRDHRARRRA